MLKSKPLLTKQSFDTTSNDKSSELYPNCDASVWLRSCENEIIVPISGKSIGTIPKWLNGCLLRNGPGNLKVGDYQLQHLFDSAALIHKFTIKDGCVTYQCRFVASNSWLQNRAANRIVVGSYGTQTIPDPCHTIFQRVSSVFVDEPINDNCNISIYPLGDEFYAFTECPIIHRIDIDSLATVATQDIRQYVGVVNHTSHPHMMPDGTVFNLGLSIKNNFTQPNNTSYNIIRFPNGTGRFENASILAEIPARWQLNPSYMHSFAATANYFVIIEQPLSISLVDSIKAKYLKRPLAWIFKWFNDEFTYFYVVCRHTGARKFTFKTSAFFYLHTINAYEKSDHIIVDICCYRDPSVLDCMYVEAMENMQTIPNYANMFRSRPLRFVLPLDQKVHCELPTVQAIWTRMKTFARRSFAFSIDRYLQKHANTGVFIDSERMKMEFWTMFEYEYDVTNLVNLTNTQCRAYYTDDSIIYCVPERLCGLGCETPRINDQFGGKEYEFFYAISSDVDADHPGTIIKINVNNKTTLLWNERNVYPSEPIFVPAPNAKSEDDGVILSAIIWGNGDENRVGLLVLCAKTMKELGRCEFETPGPVPKCLHGWFHSN